MRAWDSGLVDSPYDGRQVPDGPPIVVRSELGTIHLFGEGFIMPGSDSFVRHLECVCCGRVFDAGGPMTCPDCGDREGILDVCFDLQAVGAVLNRSTMAGRPLSIWRYRELLPDGCTDEINTGEVNSDRISTDVGWTPIIEAPRLASWLGVGRVRLKEEGQSPSGSYKDRASAVGVALALRKGCRQIACASTGNAATSLARAAANAGIGANIFVGRDIPEGKLAQLLAYGARVFWIQGTYAQAYDLSMEACRRFGWYNRNCAVNPYLVEGKKTGGLEIAEQCADDPPDWVAVSVGDGCTVAGVAKGLRQMREIGMIDWPCRVLGVQAEGVAPIAEAAEKAGEGRQGGNPCKSDRAEKGQRNKASGLGTTYADSINVPVPRNVQKAIRGVQESDGCFVTVSDEQIRDAVVQAGRLSGVFAEPAAAASVAGIAEARRRGILDERSSVLAIVTGTGLKDVPGAMSALAKPRPIAPEFSEVERIVQGGEGARPDGLKGG